MPDPEPVPPDLLAGQHGQGGEEDHGTGAAEGCGPRLCQDTRGYPRDSRSR